MRPHLILMLIGALIAAPAMAASDAAPAESSIASGRIARSNFTTAVVDREPVDNVTVLSTANGKVYYFTELLDMMDQVAVHRWTYNGELMAEVAFEIQGPRWRVWSSKSLLPAWTGDWRVSVLNGAGEVIGGNRFTYRAAE